MTDPKPLLASFRELALGDGDDPNSLLASLRELALSDGDDPSFLLCPACSSTTAPIDPSWVSNLMFWAPEHSQKCWYHQIRGGNELWHYRLCIQSPLLYRSTTGLIPQPPLPAAQSRESRIGSHRTAQIRPKSGRPRPLAWPTTCCQVWPLLKVSLAHSSHRSTTQRARPWPPVVIRGR